MRYVTADFILNSWFSKSWKRKKQKTKDTQDSLIEGRPNIRERTVREKYFLHTMTYMTRLWHIGREEIITRKASQQSERFIPRQGFKLRYPININRLDDLYA